MTPAPFPSLRKGRPAVLLAPMEGVTDASMRALLTELGGFTFCVSEFLRVSQDIPPARVFRDHVPELKVPGCATGAGTPVSVQLLGGDPDKLARTALVAIDAGAQAIDLNFGCPAKTVNRHDGGSTLLKYPERIRDIVRAVREAVPREIPVSAKVRLGWDSIEPIHRNAEMAALGGADWITIHARTKAQGYAPPVFWEPIGEVRRALDIPVVANGDLWTIEAFRRCREITGCEHYMIGRSAMANPWLAQQISAELGISAGNSGTSAGASAGSVSDATTTEAAAAKRAEWNNTYLADPKNWLPLLRRFESLAVLDPSYDGTLYTLRRIKQWLRMAQGRLPLPWADPLKRTQTLDELFTQLVAFDDRAVGQSHVELGQDLGLQSGLHHRISEPVVGQVAQSG